MNHRLLRKIKDNYKFPNLSEEWPNDVKRVFKLINNNLFSTEITVSHIYMKCKIKNKNFSSRFKFYVGKTPKHYIIYHRIICSKKIMVDTNGKTSLSTIGFLVGFSTQSAFTAIFKSKVGVPPSEWLREKNQEYS